MRAQIRHLTEYHYPDPAADSFNELRLQPAQTEYQSLLGFNLRLEPEVPVYTHSDYYGTAVHHFHIFERHSRLSIETNAVVVTHRKPEPQPALASSLTAPRERLLEYLGASQYVPLGPWAERIGYPHLSEDDELLTYLSDLNRHVHARFEYKSGLTGIGTPLEEFLTLSAGVCQDYTHLMLAVCRQMRVPARYVSGYLHAGSDFRGAEATHAWAECYLPGSGWVGFDPTNATLETEAHVRIGHGRDYDDVAPMRGLRRGGGQERLGVNVSVQVQQQ